MRPCGFLLSVPAYVPGSFLRKHPHMRLRKRVGVGMDDSDNSVGDEVRHEHFWGAGGGEAERWLRKWRQHRIPHFRVSAAPEGIHSRPSVLMHTCPSVLKSRMSRKAHLPGQAGGSPDPLCSEDKALGFLARGKGETGDGHLMQLLG